MNFIAQVEDQLRDLANEARKKYPGVKEAAERAILTVRTLKTRYVSAVRAASSASAVSVKSNDSSAVENNGLAQKRRVRPPTTALFKHTDIIRPFLLALNYVDGPSLMLNVALTSVQMLIDGDAVCPQDSINIMHVLSIHTTKHDESYNLKVLQTATMVAAWRGAEMSEEVLSKTIVVCMSMAKQKSSTVRRASMATLSQLTSLLFDRVTSSAADHLEELTASAASAFFTDICAIAENQSPQQLTGPFAACASEKNLAIPPRSFCFELLDMILSTHPFLFAPPTSPSSPYFVVNENFFNLLRYKACPLVTMTLLSEYHLDSAENSMNDTGSPRSNKHHAVGDFPILVRSMKLSSTIIKTYGGRELGGECHILLSTMLRFISSATDAFKSNGSYDDGFSYNGESNSINDSGIKPKTIPNNLLWRAALALETLHSLAMDSALLRDLHTSMDSLLGEGSGESSIVASIVSMVSDFFRVAAANKSNILAMIAAASVHDNHENTDLNLNYHPQIFVKAKESLKAYDEAESRDLHKASNHSGRSSIISPLCDNGEVIWLSFFSIFSIAQSLMSIAATASSKNRENSDLNSLTTALFVPSLAMFEHILMRCPMSMIVTKYALEGYKCLAMCTIIPNNGFAEEQRTILASLSKQSIASWGNKSTCSIRDNHVLAFSTLLHITHTQFEFIGSDLEIIFNTIVQLSSYNISSAKLSSEALDIAIDLSLALSRLAIFSTCLSVASLHELIKSLVSLCTSNYKRRTISKSDDSPNTVDLDGGSVRVGVASQLFGMAGRALIGTANLIAPPAPIEDLAVPGPELPSIHSFLDDFYELSFSRAIEISPKTRKAVFEELPFPLVALVEIAHVNAFRFEPFWYEVSSQIVSLINESDSDARGYAIDSLRSLIVLHLTGKTSQDNRMSSPKEGLISTVDFFSVEFPLVSAATPVSPVSQIEIFKPLFDAVTLTLLPDVAEMGLAAIFSILEASGEILKDDVWPNLIATLDALSGGNNNVINRSSSPWVTSGNLAFRTLKLIVNDFFDYLPSYPSPAAKPIRSALLSCCSSFGCSSHDVNTSLTATSMLWTIADQDPTQSSIEPVLSKLLMLASDKRAEVRNCSVNTIFSCVVGQGQNFSINQWKSCFGANGVLFGVIDDVCKKYSGLSSQPNTNDGVTVDPRFQLTVHHSRDSESKQWATTQCLTLQGLGRIFRNFFTVLFKLSSGTEEAWFNGVWEKVVSFAFTCAKDVNDNADVSVAGIDLLILLAQLSSVNGFSRAANAVRVGTNMKVVDGALETYMEGGQSKLVTEPLTLCVDDRKIKYFIGAFEKIEKLPAYIVETTHDWDSKVQQNISGSGIISRIFLKLSDGLLSILECCKDVEMAPLENCEVPKANVQERAIAISLQIILKTEVLNSAKSKHPTPAQRSAVEFLRSQKSTRAFTQISMLANGLFCSKMKSEIEYSPALKLEAAKALASSFATETISSSAKVNVLSDVVHDFREYFELVLKSKSEQRTVIIIENLELLLKMVSGGLNAASCIEMNDSLMVDNIDALNSVWNGILGLLYSLLIEKRYPTKNLNDVLTLVSLTTSKAPPRIYSNLAEILSKASKKFMRDIKSQLDMKDEELLQLFRSCFSALSFCEPDGTNIQSIAEQSLEECVSSIQKHKTNPSVNYQTNVEVALVVCDQIRTENVVLSRLAIHLFPFLCKMTTFVEYTTVQQTASRVLGSVDVPSVVSRAMDQAAQANERARSAEERAEKLEVEVVELRKKVLDRGEELVGLWDYH